MFPICFLSVVYNNVCFSHSSSKKTVQLIESKKDLACELVASWSVQVGDLDQCIHIWRYTGGFGKVDLAEKTLQNDAVNDPLLDNLYLVHHHSLTFFYSGLRQIGS